MTKIAGFLLFMCIFGFAAEADESRWNDAYARRDYQLGITLTEFRSIAYPDQKEWPGAYPVCSNEDRVTNSTSFLDAKIYDAELIQAGLIKCTFYYESTVTATREPLSAGLVLGNINSRTDFYFLEMDSSSAPILFWITSGGPSSQFNEVSRMFSHALGEPTERKTETLQNNTGAKFEASIHIWRNRVSEIEIRQYGETIKAFQLNHRLLPVFSIFSERVAEIEKRNAKRL